MTDSLDAALESTILELLSARADEATICPSDAARALAAAALPDAEGDAWRDLMEPAREAARRLVARGEVDITQGGRVVPDPAHTKGPIRIRRRGPGSS